MLKINEGDKEKGRQERIERERRKGIKKGDGRG